MIQIYKEIFIEKIIKGKVYSGLVPIETMHYNSHNNSWTVNTQDMLSRKA